MHVSDHACFCLPAECKFSFTKDAGEPPLVTKNLTSSRGRLKFQQSPDVQCAASGDQVVVSHWLYLLNGGWVSGHGNAFRVETKRVGSLWNTKQLTFLEVSSSVVVVIFRLNLSIGLDRPPSPSPFVRMT